MASKKPRKSCLAEASLEAKIRREKLRLENIKNNTLQLLANGGIVVALAVQTGIDNNIQEIIHKNLHNDATLYNERLGTLLIVFGLYYAFNNARKLLSAHGRKLATEGQFGVSRNPIYNGYRIYSAGLFAFQPTPENFLAGMSVYLFSEAAARTEERLLETKFDREYLLYKERVPRWIPHYLSGLFSRIVNPQSKNDDNKSNKA